MDGIDSGLVRANLIGWAPFNVTHDEGWELSFPLPPAGRMYCRPLGRMKAIVSVTTLQLEVQSLQSACASPRQQLRSYRLNLTVRVRHSLTIWSAHNLVSLPSFKSRFTFTDCRPATGQLRALRTLTVILLHLHRCVVQSLPCFINSPR